MRICVFQSSYEGSGSVLGDLHDSSQPGLFTSQHEFAYRFIHKDNAQQEIDAAVAEGFDFYFNFLWGTLDDPVAGTLASRYFESLGLPSCGVRSWERSMTKNDFYQTARLHGTPPVPGADRFPLFVKPANGCASQLIDEHSVCHNQEELDLALGRINKSLHEARIRRAHALGIKDPVEYASSYDPTSRDNDDVVVQEYIDGKDYTCSVVEMGQSCIALTPFVYNTKQTTSKDKFLTFDLKFDQETRIELLQKQHNPTLFERLQQVAMEAFTVSGCKGSNMGCDVDLRATPTGEVFAIEVNPQPAAFMPDGVFQDLPIIHSLPGGHSAVINIFIANHMLGHPDKWSHQPKIASLYDGLAPKYDTLVNQAATMVESARRLADRFEFSGTVLDLACGTGIFGRALAESKKSSSLAVAVSSQEYRLLGCDISPGMLDICRSSGAYDNLFTDSMESTLLRISSVDHGKSVDHITCLSSMHFLRPEMFSFVMVLCFTLANKSVTISVDEIPDVYNEKLKKLGHDCMHSTNHLASMESFCEPKGWRLECRERQYSWTSPATGDRIYTTYFRFERVDGDTRDVMVGGLQLPN
ncbi:2-C-methyl-D-erythritol 2,4-cyclodiphosphate synthase [Metarhizium anisopliae]